MTSETFLGFGMKYDTSEPNYPKVGNELFNSFTTALNNLFKPLTILFTDSLAPFHSICACLIQSLIFNLAYLALRSECTLFPSLIYLRALLLIDTSSESSSVYDSSIEEK